MKQEELRTLKTTHKQSKAKEDVNPTTCSTPAGVESLEWRRVQQQETVCSLRRAAEELSIEFRSAYHALSYEALLQREATGTSRQR